MQWLANSYWIVDLECTRWQKGKMRRQKEWAVAPMSTCTKVQNRMTIQAETQSCWFAEPNWDKGL